MVCVAACHRSRCIAEAGNCMEGFVEGFSSSSIQGLKTSMHDRGVDWKVSLLQCCSGMVG